MDLDDREMRLRSRFGFMMCWSAFAIIGLGFALGALLEILAAATDPSFRVPGAHGHLAMVAGHVLAGLVVITMVLRSYLAPDPRG